MEDDLQEDRGEGVTILCRLDEISDPGGKGFTFGEGTARREIFVMRKGGRVWGYANRCPHAGIALNFGDDVFCLYDSDGERDVICPHHSALFRLPEGICHEGPCRDDRLTPVPLAVEAGVVRIAPAR